MKRRYYVLERGGYGGVNWIPVDGPYPTKKEATVARETIWKATPDMSWEDYDVVSRTALKDRYPLTDLGDEWLEREITC